MQSEVIADTNSENVQSRLGQCEVCDNRLARYTCPKCELKTCSLNCNKIHKLEIECDGQRNRTKFIPIKEFTNLDLSSDYRLLEEAARVVEVSKKAKLYKKDLLPRHLFKLRHEAMLRKTTLKFLPRSFNKHKNNSTQFNFKLKMIEWKIDWVFVNADNFRITNLRVNENKRISSIIIRHLKMEENEEIREKLQFYQAVDLPGIQFFLKAEQKKGGKFYELDSSMTLKECLRNKVVIEHPTIHVVLKNHVNCYNIIDSDDQNDDNEMAVDEKLKFGEEVINKIIKTAEKEDCLNASLKNLLFVNENSDLEASEEDGSFFCSNNN